MRGVSDRALAVINAKSDVSPQTLGRDQSAQNFAELHRRICCVEDEIAYTELLQVLQHPTHPYVVSFVNAHAANLVWRNPALFDCLLRSDLLLRDGVGVQFGLKAFGRPCGMNMNGTDLIPQIASAYVGRRVALFGTRSPWLDVACKRFEAIGVRVVASHDGFSTAQTYVDLAAETKPDLIILAMGMPKQEFIASQLRDRLSHPVLIVNGGAVLDFLGGKVTRAPKMMLDARTEWFYRLCLEPRRLARRYVVGIPVFFAHIARARRVVHHATEFTGAAAMSRPVE
jgi:N-acetylglucosaminyldiphosphoundecaprenol N-acetyl-beta-D-mannosaminyltransferase